MDLCRFMLLIIVQIISVHQIVAYKHVILMHGLFGSPLEFFKLENFIQKTHPQTPITAINAYNVMTSLDPMWKQVEDVRTKMSAIMGENPDGVHLICYSQGGLLCRAVLHTLPDHNVNTFISLSSPQAGQYGDTKFLKYLFPHMLKEELHKFFYSKAGQDISIGNYWNDPHHQADFVESSKFLAVINNQSSSNHSMNQQFRKNFMRLKKLVLIGGPSDEVITPWQSSHFAAYNEKEEVVEMKKQVWYEKDSFGLRSLDERGDIVTYVVPGPSHLEWPRNYTVFQNCMMKWLD